MRKKVLVIIPAYNEHASIIDVTTEINVCCKSMNEYDIDYIVINDCSTDDTLELLMSNDREYLSLPLNLGIGGGVQTGYKYALLKDYDVAIQVDGDGQHDASYIKDIVDPILNEECDLVVGSRFVEYQGFQSSGIRRLGIGWLSFMVRVMGGVSIKDVTSGFRAAGKKAILAFAEEYAQDYPEPESIVMCAKKKMKIKEVPVVMRERVGGKSSISPLKSIYYMIKVTLAIIFTGIIY